MKKSMLTAVALSALATLFFSACSSDNSGPKNISCQLVSGCSDAFNVDQCIAAGGTVISTCTPSSNSNGGNSGVISCLIGGLACTPVLSNEVCAAAGGQVVNSCNGSDQFVLCDVMGTCMALTNSAQCTLTQGTVVQTCPGSGNNNSSSGGGDPGNNNSSSSGGNPGNNNSSSSAGGGTVNCQVDGICFESTASECSLYGGTQVTSCPELPPKPTLFCDFGYPSTSGGGCYPIGTESECDLEYGRVASRCGQRNDQFCHWSSTYECHLTASASACQTDFGTPVSLCPINTLPAANDNPFYCYYGDSYGSCDRIGGSTFGTASTCATAGGAIVRRNFCTENGIQIYM